MFPKSATALAVATTIAVAAATTPAKADVRWRHCPAPVYGYDSYSYRYPAKYRPYARRPSGLIHESGHQSALLRPSGGDARWRRADGYEPYYGYRYPANYRSYARRPYEYDHQYGLRRFPAAVRARSWSP